MTTVQEEAFWCGLDMETGEELELGLPPTAIQLEEVGWWIPWGLAVEPAQEGQPLLPLGLGPIEVDGAEQALEDGAAAEDAVGEQEDSLPS